MPLKKLPGKLVERLRRAGAKLEEVFATFEPIDRRLKTQPHRAESFNHQLGLLKKMVEDSRKPANWPARLLRSPRVISPKEAAALRLSVSDVPGYRVRAVDVGRNYPKARLALKLVHGQDDAKALLREIRRRVRAHNSLHGSAEYFLLPPFAYAVSDKLVAMHRTSKPSVVEVVRYHDRPTKRGVRMRKTLEADGISPGKLRSLANLAAARINEVSQGIPAYTFFHAQNLLVIGSRQGKPVFMPYLDSY